MPLNWESEVEFESVKEVSRCCWRIAACSLEVRDCLKIQGIIRRCFSKFLGYSDSPSISKLKVSPLVWFIGSVSLCIKQTISSALT